MAHTRRLPIDHLTKHAIAIAKATVSVLILCTIAALIIFMAREVYDLFHAFPVAKDRKILHDIAFLIVIVKAFKVLLSYLQNAHISIKYIVEISIIAPSIEIVFAADKWPLWLNIVFAVFGGFNLVVYLLFYEKIARME
jgi:uncharacterized membrane protein (DUF373 family)